MKGAPHRYQRKRILPIGLLVLVLCALSCATPPQTPPTPQEGVEESATSGPRELEDIQVLDESDYLDVVLLGSDSIKYTAFKAIDPLRVVVDLANTTAETVRSPLAVENEIVSKIETVVLPEGPQPLTRVEIGLNLETPYEISQVEEEVRVRFDKPIESPQAVSVQPEAGEPQPAVSPMELEPTEQAASPAHAAASEPQAPATSIVAIRPVVLDQTLKVYIVANGKLSDYNAFHLSNPPRLVIDLMGVASTLDQNFLPLKSPLAKDIRIGRHRNKTRLVFDLVPASGLPYQVVPGADRLVVTFEPGPGFPEQPETEAAAPAEPSRPEASRAEVARIEAIDFNLLDSGESRLRITADRPLRPDVQITGPNSLSLVLEHAKIPRYLRRHIDTGQFASAVNLIEPRIMPGAPDTVDINIEVREMVPYHLSVEDNHLYLDFEPSSVPPLQPIELGKPVTVAEARGPEEPLSPAEAAEAPPAEPEQPAAPGEIAVEEAPVVAVEEAAQALETRKVYTGERISLDLQDVDIRNVLRLLADVTGKNLVVEPNVKGTVTLKVEKVPWDQVLDLILKINGLGQVVEGNVIRIATMEKIQSEQERRIAAIKAEQERLAAAKDLGEINTEYLQVNYADAQNVANQIEEIKSDKGSISVDDRTNLIIYSDFPKRIETAQQIVARLDRATPQVMIEARIVEASTNFSRDLGIQWGQSYTVNSLANRLGGPVTIQGLLGGNNFAVSAPVGAIGSVGLSFARTATNLLNLDLRLTALENTGEIRLVSSPRIFTLDNVEASIQQGEQIPYPQQSEDGISTAFVAATLSLKVTPHITPDDKVRLEVNAKNDFADFGRTVNGSPAINTREAKTELLVNNGDTIVIGGIVKQDHSWSEDRVPLLAKIPLLGWLFKKREVSDNKSELLIFLSPTIIRDGEYT